MTRLRARSLHRCLGVADKMVAYDFYVFLDTICKRFAVTCRTHVPRQMLTLVIATGPGTYRYSRRAWGGRRGGDKVTKQQQQRCDSVYSNQTRHNLRLGRVETNAFLGLLKPRPPPSGLLI